MGMDRFDFTNFKPIEGVVTQEDVPPTPPYAQTSQTYEMPSKAVFHVFNEDRSVFTAYHVEEWLTVGKSENDKVVRLRGPKSATIMHLSTWQIGQLEKTGRIIPFSATLANGVSEPIPGYGHTITGERLSKADRYLEYITAITEAHESYSKSGRSRQIIVETVKSVAERRNEKAPAISVISDKLERYDQGKGYDNIAAVADKPRPGNRRRHFPTRAEQALHEAVEASISVSGDWSNVKALLHAWTEPDGQYSDLPNLVKPVGDCQTMVADRTIQRRLASVDHFTRDSLNYGDEFAERKHAVRIRQSRPSFPLDIVDVDHSTLNIVVYDGEIAFGRPDVVVFRDRYSGIPLGWSVSFGAPSYETFLEGLLHALSPKDEDSLPEGVVYPYAGRPLRLGVDNAKHLIGLDIRSSARALGMTTVAYRPGHPWEKGALEHLFHVLGIALIEMLPGSTAMSPAERKKFDDSRLKAVPEITIAELNGFLAYYFANIYTKEPRIGLGMLPSLKAVPADLWSEGISKIPKRPVVDPAALVRLAASSREVGISGSGSVRWGNLEYQSDALKAIQIAASHKVGEGKHHGRKYHAVRDPADLGKIWVQTPLDTNRVIEVPISPAFALYANGLRLYQHNQIMAHHREKARNEANAPDLMKSKAELTKMIVDIHSKRRKHSTAMTLSRFMTTQSRRIQRSMPIVMDDSAVHERLDLANPHKAKQVKPRSPLAKAMIPAPKARDTEIDDEREIAAVPAVPAQMPEPPRASEPRNPGQESIDDLSERNSEWDD